MKGGQLGKLGKLSGTIKTVLGVSPLTLLKAVCQPGMVPVRLAKLRHSGIQWAAGMLFPGVERRHVVSLLMDLYTNHAFYDEVNRIFVEKRRARAGCGGFRDFIYLMVRLAEPEVVVETGVWDGQSTAVVLQALADNDKGRLISIDLPASESIPFSTEDLGEGTLPPGCQPGWTVPERLRKRHELILGDSREWLERTLKREQAIDIFIHDSLHTDEHMTFEFECAWPFIRRGGLLMSHDIFDNPSFYRFARRHCRPFVHAIETFGAIRK